MYKNLNLKQEIKNTKQDYDNVLNKYNLYSNSVKKYTISRFKHQSLIFRFSNFDDQLGVNNHIQNMLHQSSELHKMGQQSQSQDETLLSDIINIQKTLVCIKYERRGLDLEINQKLEKCMEKKLVISGYKDKMLENEKAVKTIRSGQVFHFQLQVQKKMLMKEIKLKSMIQNNAMNQQRSEDLKQRLEHIKVNKQKIIEKQCSELFRQRHIDQYTRKIKDVGKDLPELQKEIKGHQDKLQELQEKQQKFKVLLTNKLEQLKKVLIESVKSRSKKYSYLNISMMFIELFEEKVDQKCIQGISKSNYMFMIQKSRLIVEELKKINDRIESEEKEHQFISFKFNVLFNNNFMQIIQQTNDCDELIMRLEELENKQIEQMGQEFRRMPEKMEEYKQMVGCLLQGSNQKMMVMKLKNMNSMGSNSMKSSLTNGFGMKSNESSTRHIGVSSLVKQNEKVNLHRNSSYGSNQ